MNHSKHKQEIDLDQLRELLLEKNKEERREKLFDWFNNISHESNLRNILRKHWEELELASEDYQADTAPILDKIHHQMQLESFRKSWEMPAYRRLYMKFSKIAAILLLPLIAVSLWYFIAEGSIRTLENNPVFAEIHSPPASRTQFELPDGSTGWLNSGSTLKFPVKFSRKVRKVELSGEGYFNVRHNTKKPFVVEVNDIDVIALGTSFNVSAYPDQLLREITLESGKLVLEKEVPGDKQFRFAELKPNEQLIINSKAEVVDHRVVETMKYTSWKEGKLIFRNDPMTEVIRKISNWYNVDIQLRDKELENYVFRATFEDEALGEVLNLLKISSPIDYIEHERVKNADGSFARKRITLFLKTDRNQ